MKKKIFYGWVNVAIGFISQVSTGISYHGFATYVTPLQREFGWSNTSVAAGRSLTQAETALFGPINGYLVDKIGPRIMMASGICILGLGLILFSFVHSLWEYFATSILMAIGVSFSSLLTTSIAINNWFRRKRTIAIGIASIGFAMGGVVAVPMLVGVQSDFGWRSAAFFSSIAIWLVCIPASLMLRVNPEKYGLLPDGGTSEEYAKNPNSSERSPSPLVNFTVSEAIRTRSFWCVSVSTAFWSFAVSALTVFQFAHMEGGVGLTRWDAALVIAMQSVFNVCGRLVGGVLGDKMPKYRLLAVSTLGTSVAISMLALAKSMSLTMVSGIIYGLSWGIRTPVAYSIQGEYFGRAAFGRILGISQLLSSLLSIIGPIFAGFLVDATGDHKLSFLVLSLAAGISFVIVLLASPPKLPTRVAA